MKTNDCWNNYPKVDSRCPRSAGATYRAKRKRGSSRSRSRSKRKRRGYGNNATPIVGRVHLLPWREINSDAPTHLVRTPVGRVRKCVLPACTFRAFAEPGNGETNEKTYSRDTRSSYSIQFQEFWKCIVPAFQLSSPIIERSEVLAWNRQMKAQFSNLTTRRISD